MSALSLIHTLRRGLLALALAAASGLAAAGAIHVEIDTSSFGSSGWLDLQFNPAGGDTPALAQALVSNFVGFNGADPVQLAGDVSGSLAAGYLFSNTPGWNDLFHSVQFGGILAFDVSFSGEADLDAFIGQSLFSISAYADDQMTLLGNYGADGTLAALSWTPAAVAGGLGAVGIAVYDTANVSAVPEPSAWLLMATGLGMVCWFGARRRGGKDGAAALPLAA